MTPAYQCPKSHGHDFVLVSKVHRLEPRSFLWFTWVHAVYTGWIVRCPDHACGRFWRVGLDGVHEPAGHARELELPAVNGRPEREEDEREATPALGLAVRRPRL
jgi:hypothetical protein